MEECRAEAVAMYRGCYPICFILGSLNLPLGIVANNNKILSIMGVSG